MPSTTIVDMPFPYDQTVVRPRHRNPEQVRLRSSVPVELRTVGDADAPVALTLVRTDLRDRYPDRVDAGFVADPPVEHYRHFDGKLWRPLLHSGPMSVSALARDLSRPSYEWRRPRWGRHADDGPEWTGAEIPVAVSPSRPRPYARDSVMHLHTREDYLASYGSGTRPRLKEHDEGAGAARAVELLGEAMLVVDDEVWTSWNVGEPHYEVVAGSGPVTLELVLRREPLAYVTAFRLDALDRAHAFAASLGGAEGYVRYLPVVTVRNPTVLRFDETAAVAAQVASGLRGVVREVDLSALPERPRSMLEALRAAGNGAGPPSEDVLATLDAFHGEMEGTDVPSDAVGIVLRRTFHALLAWKAHPDYGTGTLHVPASEDDTLATLKI